MLKKSFKIAKCKTSLKLATSRIKLMKNKKVEQINHMKRELAQLLASGDDRTARIRVEHVIREQKMIAAYDLIEIYCELIVARLPIIESQKTCPIDLKEAVTSVIFAAPRCSDIPELADARKNFTAKYGKEFVSGAIELRPDCGVSRMLVEKLSAVAPDIQTKMKVLTSVAKEHNINWDSTSFEEKESKPPYDLLNGPTNFEKASTVSVDPPKIQTTSVPIVHHHEANQNPNVPLDFAQQNKRFTVDSQHKTNLDTGGVQTSYASTTHNDMRPSGSTPGTMNMRQSFNSNRNDHWNMEFTDATSAAQAAAESAERASFAARAAAELSRQFSNESRQSSHIQDEKPQVLYNDKSDISLNDRKPKSQNQQMGAIDSVNKRSSSLRSRNDSVNKSSVNQFEIHEDYGPSPTMSSKSKSKDRYTSGDMSTSDPRKAGQKTVVDQGRVFRETSRTGSYGDAHKDDETDTDDDDAHGPKFDTGFEYDEGEAKLFFPSPERGSFRLPEKTHVSSPKSNMGQAKISNPVDHSVKSDLSDAPDSESESETGKTSFGRIKKVKSPHKHDILSTDHLPAYEESSPKANARKSRIELDDLVENKSENAMGMSRFSGSNNSSSPRKHQLLYTSPEPTSVESSSPKINSRKSRIELNDLVETGQDSESESEMRKPSFSSTKKLTSPHKHDVFSMTSESANVKSSPKSSSRKSRVEFDDLVETGSSFDNQSDDLDSRSDLKFGTLTGGLRNKGGLKYPPYTKTAGKESQTKVEPTSRPSSFNKRSNVSVSSESDSDDYGERPQFAPPDSFFNNDETCPEEEVSSDRKQTYTSNVHSGSGLSRRTKGQVQPVGKTVISNQSPGEARSYTEKLKKNPDKKLESSEFSSASAERQPSTKSHSTKSSSELQPDAARFKQEPFQPRPARFKQEPSRPDPARFKQEPSRPDPAHVKQEPFRPDPARFKQEQSPPGPARFEQEPSRPNPARFKQEPSKTIPEPKISEQPPNPPQKGPESGKPETSKTVNPSSTTSPEASNVKKPSHVHPKLPDYDSLAARIQALSKMNR